MKQIYIGVPFELTLRKKDGIAFEDAPQVCLISASQRKYFKAKEVVRQTDLIYTASFDKETSLAMQPGVYNLEVYNADKSVLIKYETDFAEAIIVSASGQSEDATPTISNNEGN